MHVDVSIRPSSDQSSHIDVLFLVRWAKAGKREALLDSVATTIVCVGQIVLERKPFPFILRP